ncbi:MAG: 50S ribosome-binding GTPase [Phycisphaerae bacterium]|nr:50S ribosome-binding GTPase [Phycisphaerae bacterium]
MNPESEPLTASLQTPPGKGGIAVIALRGQGLTPALRAVFRPRRGGKDFPAEQPGRLHLGNLIDGEDILDEAVVALHPRGAEINIHGGPTVARRVLRRLGNLGAAVATGRDEAPFPPAHPQWRNPAIGGELQAALPDAPSLWAAAALTNQWSAGLSKLAREFLDSPTAPPEATEPLQSAADAFAATRKLLHPPEVVLAGAPNAGKSTLTNALVGRPVSIVHEQAGTTRDWVRQRAILAGRCVYLTDTAGLWETDHPIEAESVRRAWQRIASADLVLLLSEADPIDLPAGVRPKIITKNLLHVRTKCDEPDDGPGPEGLAVSAHTGRGMPELIAAVLDALGLANIDPAAPSAFTARQETLLRAAADSLRRNTPAWRDALRKLLEE